MAKKILQAKVAALNINPNFLGRKLVFGGGISVEVSSEMDPELAATYQEQNPDFLLKESEAGTDAMHGVSTQTKEEKQEENHEENPADLQS